MRNLSSISEAVIGNGHLHNMHINDDGKLFSVDSVCRVDS